MATTEFEVQQLLKAYRKGIISEELFAKQMAEIGATGNGHGAATAPQPAAPGRAMRGLTGDASIDGGAKGAAMKQPKTHERTGHAPVTMGPPENGHGTRPHTL